MENTRIPEYRANAKSLTELRAEAIQEMQTIITNSQTETRAMTDEENARLEELEQSVKDIDRTLAAQKRAMALFEQPEPDTGDTGKTPDGGAPAAPGNDGITEEEKRAFLSTVQSLAGEKRAGEQNFTMGNNGAVISQSIANRIIDEVKEICPILNGCTMYSVKGTLKVPVYGNKTADSKEHNITVAYAEEFTELTADAGAFTSIDLTGYLVGALTLIGKSVINNSDIPVFDFIISEVAKKIAVWIEGELLTGTSGKCTGALSTTNVIKAESTTAITADKLIEIQAKVPTVFQTNACWTMHPETFTAIRKLKDSTGQYLLQQSSGIANAFPYMLLGKPVYLSDNMPKIASGAKTVLYGDYSGLSVNMREAIEMQILAEKYATMHAIGIVSWLEIDSKITEYQKLAALVMSAS